MAVRPVAESVSSERPAVSWPGSGTEPATKRCGEARRQDWQLEEQPEKVLTWLFDLDLLVLITLKRTLKSDQLKKGLS